MSVTIGSVTFDRDPVWTDRYDRNEVPATVYKSINGTENVVEGAWGGEFPITMEATEKWGRITGDRVEQLYDLARVRGATYVLQVGSDTCQVRFRNE